VSPDTRGGSDAEEPIEDAEDRGSTTTTHRPGDDVVHPAAAERQFGRRGDVLLVVLFLSLVVAPLVVYLRPPALPWHVRTILFPLLPAIGLGVVAVWATTRP